MKYKTINKILIFFFLVMSSTQFVAAQGALAIQILPVFNGKPLQLNEKMYRTENGDSVSIETFKFYMSSLKLLNDHTVYQEPNSYHLVDSEDSNSLYFKIEQIPSGIYSSLSFNIGVDSVASVSGALGGDLDPTLGMYWAWNTGYINAKLVGSSPSCNTIHNQFEFHIGGYKEPYLMLRKVQIPLRECTIKDGLTQTIILQADVATWFSGIHLTSLNNVVLPSVEALKIADYYMEMFHDSSNIAEKK